MTETKENESYKMEWYPHLAGLFITNKRNKETFVLFEEDIRLLKSFDQIF